MTSILRGICTGDALPAIVVDEPPTNEGLRYRVREGFHRYYASAAAGFTHVPVLLRPYFDINTC